MKLSKQSGPLHAAYYLIEAEGEYEKAILEYLAKQNAIDYAWGMRARFNLDELIEGHRINGNRQLPSEYPFIMAVNIDHEYNRLTVHFITENMFDQGCVNMHISELKQEVQATVRMEAVYDKIKEAYANNEKELTFQDTETPDPDSRYALHEVQVDILRSNGYNVEWNGPCQWWEVSGWK